MHGHRRAARALGALVLIGGVVLLVGTFLPWVRSGSVLRSSYSGAGVLRRLLDVHGAAGTALRLWPLVGAWLALCALLALVGRRVLAAGLTLVAAVPAAAVSVIALSVKGRFGVTPVGYGPTVTGVGAVLVVIGAVGLVIVTARSRRRRATGQLPRRAPET